ncbi:MAG: hypothetical protein A4E67_02109 [Syntrophaceae bacterium PtaB.Bin038]|nr:MAG: hypothetical protein A4E67_02109 [Syntrophaceae bacterium PtaB.Bin038]
MDQSMKKPRKPQISDEDWNRYVEALRRANGRTRGKGNPKKSNQAKGARP